MALNIVCWATRFQMVIPLRSHTAPDARRAYLEWVRFMGVPQRLFTDLGKEFCSAFQDGAELDETLVEPSALEMPTQRAITERAGKTFKEILEKAMDNYATQSESEWRDLVDIVNMTVNRLTNKSGYSPCQRLLGYTPKMPGGLQFLTEEEKKERQWANRGDLQMQRAQTMRLAAAKAFHEIECQQAMKNAIHHGRRSIKDFEVGQTVYFWRRAPGDKASKESTRYWRGPAKVVLTSPPGAVWINFRRHIVKAAPEQLRHASMEEHQSLSSWMEGLSHLRQIIEEEPKAGYIDLTKEYKEEDFEDEEEDIPLESRDSRKEKPKYKIEGKTERKDVVMREEEDEWLWNEAKQTLTRFHLQYRQHLFKPTDVSDCPVDYNKLGPQRRTTMYFEDGSSKEIVDDWHEEAQPVHKRWKGRTEFQMMIEKFAWEKGEPEAEETTRMTSPTVSLSGTTTEEAKIGLKRGAGEDEENNEGLEKRARTETVEDQKKEEEPIRGLSRPFEIDGEDQEQIPKRQRIDWFEVMINTVMPVMKKPKGQNEIKLKQLLDEAKTKYYKAIKKEIDNNIKTGAYEILSPEASEEVRRAGHNILQSRYVLVEKRIEEDEVPAMQEEGILLRTDEHGGFKAKARHVMKGFSEPDSEWLEAATPQVAPETVLLILQTISSSRWTPGYLDFTQAFHSGDPISRDMLEANALSKEAMEEVETGIVLRPIPMKDIRIGSASDARHTVFVKKKSSKKIEIHERFLQVGRTHSQGGHIVFAYHKNLETEQTPQPISVLSWKSSRLKRRTVNTLAAEAQAMVQAVGASYWIRFLLAEIKGLKMSLQNWQKQISRTPYMTATDSRSLFDNLTRSTNVAAHIEDKRTAIDLAILKNDMNTTRGQTRWVASRLKELLGGAFLRMDQGDPEGALPELQVQSVNGANASRYTQLMKCELGLCAGPEAAAWSAARRDTALQVCRTILERGGILVERGHEAVLKQTLQDGSSVICTRCGALVAWSRAEAHRAIWCSSLGDQVAETDAAPGDASNDDMDIDYGAPTGC
ncbi:unnamed protein product [Durusdinium trenchii]|uniref:Integrase catalytic domain-containing protein n=1 Tax=Durusdinium trenchii TaxID=1381693 RepID=A0ABP0SYM7_9DINO